MNTKEHNKLAMYQAVKSVLDANKAAWRSTAAFAESCEEFTSHVKNISVLGKIRMTAKLTALQTAIDAFTGATGKPRDEFAATETIAQQISNEFAAADKILEQRLDKLIGQFQTASVKFVSDYNDARIVDIKPGNARATQGQLQSRA